MRGFEILYGRTFDTPQKDTLPIGWKMWFVYKIEILRALRFKSLYTFWNDPHVSWPTNPHNGLFISGGGFISKRGQEYCPLTIFNPDRTVDGDKVELTRDHLLEAWLG